MFFLKYVGYIILGLFAFFVIGYYATMWVENGKWGTEKKRTNVLGLLWLSSAIIIPLLKKLF